jgi:hypothetical protein
MIRQRNVLKRVLAIQLVVLSHRIEQRLLITDVVVALEMVVRFLVCGCGGVDVCQTLSLYYGL